MTTAQAVQHVLELHSLSKYRLAIEMGSAPVSVNQWLRGTKMSPAYKEIFHRNYGIKVED